MKKALLLSLCSSFLLWLAWPPIPNTGIILLFAFVPLLIAINEIYLSAGKHKNKTIALISFLCFFIWNTSSIYWVYNSLSAVMPPIIASALVLIPFCLAPILMTCCVVFYIKLKSKTNNFLANIFFVSFWISYEYLHQTWDLKFPWMTLGNGFANSTPLIQWYEYSGVNGGTLWIWVSNLLIFSIINNQSFKFFKSNIYQKSKVIVAICWLIFPAIFSYYLYLNFVEEVNPSHIVIVQPNVDPYEKYALSNAKEQLQNLIDLSKSKAKKSTEFFIWPETALVGFENEDRFRSSENYNIAKNFLSSYKNATLISGAESYAIYNYKKTNSASLNTNDNLYYDSFNSAVAIENSNHLQFYHKSKLVPGVEKMPFLNLLSFLKPLFEKFGGTTGGYGEQTEPTNLYAKSGIAVSPVICYESIWGNWVAQSVQKGGQFIAIITNDAWWGNTTGKDQHLAYAKLRAIENRRWVVRSANTGISATINQTGEMVQKSNWWQKAALSESINLNTDETFYTKHPDVVLYPTITLSVIGIILLVFIKQNKLAWLYQKLSYRKNNS